MFRTKAKKKAEITRTGDTLASMTESEFSHLCRCAGMLGVQIRDMGSGYALLKDGKRVGILSLDTPAREALSWVEWANMVPDWPTEERTRGQVK